MFTAIAILLLVLSPVLVPAIITGFHAIANWRRHHQPLRTTIRGHSLALRRLTVRRPGHIVNRSKVTEAPNFAA